MHRHVTLPALSVASPLSHPLVVASCTVLNMHLAKPLVKVGHPTLVTCPSLYPPFPSNPEVLLKDSLFSHSIPVQLDEFVALGSYCSKLLNGWRFRCLEWRKCILYLATASREDGRPAPAMTLWRWRNIYIYLGRGTQAVFLSLFSNLRF